ncbi:hypothetical protein H4R20_001362 [Coemansia guatemalensis]|uniref:Uncharacterized protein n=1 Tax=Coemansia guatemalensis TaxID=2761395 RepID=A0A9W8LTA6_9FUNG|nr:hypothetical protein H4R20_001362 [Coemansia guatemalensis]
MSGPPQTPIRYAQNQQFMARPGTPGQQIQMGTPTGQHQQQQRPMMQFRPGIPMQAQTPQQQQQQQQMLMAGMGRGAQLTPQQQAHYTQQLQQHYYQQQQQQMGAQMMRPGMAHAQPGVGMRPGFAQQQQQHQQQQHHQQQSPFAYTGNMSMAVNGVGIPGQQGHPSLIQPQTPTQGGRKRKSTKAAQDTAAASATADEAGGDELDNMQASSISLGRYQNNHNLMAEIFVALPTSTINIPKHYYEELDAATLGAEVERLSESVEECKKTHAQRMEAMKQDSDEFAEMIRMLSAKGSDANEIKRTVEERFGMEFVDNPYRVMERVPVDSIDSPEDAVYKQL